MALTNNRKNLVKQLVDTNRHFLSSVLKMVEFFGKQGLPLSNIQDGGFVQTKTTNPFEECSSEIFPQGNLQALYKLCIDSGDKKLLDYLDRYKADNQHTSPDCLVQFLDCIKHYIQQAIVSDVTKDGQMGNYGIKLVQITPQGGFLKFGLIIRYVKNCRPLQRLVDVFTMEDVNGKDVAQKILNILKTIGLNPEACRFQSYDVFGNSNNFVYVCASTIKKELPNVHHVYYAGEDLNMSFLKSCNVAVFQEMMFIMKEVVRFFLNNPRRQRRLEVSLNKCNYNFKINGKSEININVMKILCSKEALSSYQGVECFIEMYQALMDCLNNILLDKSWDFDSTNKAACLKTWISSFSFVSALQTCRHFSGYLKSMNLLLKGNTEDILSAYDKLSIIRIHFVHIKENINREFDPVFDTIKDMLTQAGYTDENIADFSCKPNETEDTKGIIKRTIFAPFIEHLISEFDSQFNSSVSDAVHGLKLLPRCLYMLSEKSEETNRMLNFYKQDLPTVNNFSGELKLWRRYWDSRLKPKNVEETLRSMNRSFFPNIHKLLLNLLLLPISNSNEVKSGRKVVDFNFPQQLESEHDSLFMLFIHNDVILDYELIVNNYEKKYPNRMKQVNPFSLIATETNEVQQP